MAEAPQKKNNLLQFAVIFLVIYAATQLIMRLFFPNLTGGQTGPGGIVLSPQSANVREGNSIGVMVQNNSDKEFTLPNRCPAPPLDVFFVDNTTLTPLTATGTAIPCPPDLVVPPKNKTAYDLSAWKYSVFGKKGTYEVRIPSAVSLPVIRTESGSVAAGSGTVVASSDHVVTARFTIAEAGSFTRLFRAIITKPFLNFLIFIASIIPGHNLGVAIIILTLAVKLLLFLPTQHAMEGQKKMQLLQPKLDELKKKHPNDPKKQQEETMRLWKEYKINPLSSCLPTLVQLPVLIGLLYVIQDSAHLAVARHMIYPMYQNLTWQFGTNFLGLDLLVPNIWVMPVLLVVLQFLQMKLAFAMADKKKPKAEIIDAKKEPVSATQMQQRIMLYALPLMIGFFSLKFPAAVSLYWGVSTLFGIGQQLIVNREHIRV